MIFNINTFSTLLISRCRDEHKKREEALKNPQTLIKLLGFAIFEAELFCTYRVRAQFTCLEYVTIFNGKKYLSCCYMYLLYTCSVYLTNRFPLVMGLFSYGLQMMPKCGKTHKVANKVQPSVSVMFLPHFDVFCDLFLNRLTATMNLIVLYIHMYINVGVESTLP